MDINEINKRISDLQISKGIKEAELESLTKELEALKKQVEKEFGTSDINKLKEIKEDLNKKLSKQIDELRQLDPSVFEGSNSDLEE